MGIAVVLDYDQWVAAYPRLATVSLASATEYWNIAGMIWSNDGTGPVSDPEKQRTLMNLLTAHIASLEEMNRATSAGGATGIVGRLTSASQGSVSASVESLGSLGFNRAWLVQTPYGALFLAATSPYRGARYVPGPRTVFDNSRPLVTMK